MQLIFKKFVTFFRIQCSTLFHPELSPQLVLIARGISLFLLFSYTFPFRRAIPYFDFINLIGSDRFFNRSLFLFFLIGFILIWLTNKVRLGSFLVGITFLISIISCRPCLSVAHTYMSVVFIVIALSAKKVGTSFLKIQVLILYIGAVINKTLEPDWWNGNYFETLMITRHSISWYEWIASMLPSKLLSTLLGLFTILVQVLMILFLWSKKRYKYAILLGISFHTMMVLMMGTMFGPFYVSLMLSYFAFIEWNDDSHNFTNERLHYLKAIQKLVYYPPFYYLFILLLCLFNPMYVIVFFHLLLSPLYLHLIKKNFST